MKWISLAIQKQPPEVFCKRCCSLKFRKMYKKKPVPEPLFKKLQVGTYNFIKKRLSSTGAFCEFCENTFFTEQLRATVSASIFAKIGKSSEILP